MAQAVRALGLAVLLAGCSGIVSEPPGTGGGTATGGGEATGGGSATGGGDAAGGGSATGGGTATGGGSATGGGGAATGGGGGGAVEVDGGVDAGPDLVPVFVAVGKQGRRAISCDDGRTWKNDVSVDDAWPVNEQYRCFSGDFTLPDGGTQSTDCDHNAYSSTSLVHLGGAFLHTLGWGAPGTFFRSTDGVSWQQVAMGANVTDLMVGNSRLITATRNARKSDDLGVTWTMSPEIPVSNGANTIWNVRGGTYGAGTYLVTSQDGANLDFAYSRDEGATWSRPTMQGGGRLDGCGAPHPVFGGGVFVTMNWSQSQNATVVCRSTDDAATWTTSTIAGDFIEGRPVWTGTEFMAWSNGKVHRSPDGAVWTSSNTQTRRGGVLSGGPNPNPVARNADGTFVGVKGGWQVWYEQQRFYRSTDGVIWDELEVADAKRGHPITVMAAGVASRSNVCP